MPAEEAKLLDNDLVALTRRAQAGDQDAFADLFNLLHQPVLNYVYHMLGDLPSAEDITQDAFIRAHERVHELGPPWDFKSWIYRIASNLAIDSLRKGKRFVDVEEPEVLRSPPTTRRPAERQVQQHEVEDSVHATLLTLPASYRQAILLREFNGLSYKEMAIAMECSYDNARQLVHRARLSFRENHGIRMMAASGAERCQELDDLLSAYQDGELTAEQRKAVKAHIASCPHCKETERDLRKVAAFMGALIPIDPSPAWAAAVREQLRARPLPETPAPAEQSPAGGGESAGAGGGSGGSGGGLTTAPGMGGLWGKAGIAALFVVGGLFFFAAGALALDRLGSLPAPLPEGGVPSAGAATPEKVAPETPTVTEEVRLASADDGEPSPTASVTVTATPCTYQVEATKNLTCRFGPDTVYQPLGYLLEGESAAVEGVNTEETWLWILNPDANGHCWVWEGGVEATCPSEVPVIAAPPTPVPPTDTPIPDTTPPSVQVSFSPTGQWRPNEDDRITFTAQAADDVGVARIEIWVRAPNAASFTLLKACQGTETCVGLGGPYPPGTLVYYAKAFDEAGNESSSKSMSVKIYVVLR